MEDPVLIKSPYSELFTFLLIKYKSHMHTSIHTYICTSQAMHIYIHDCVIKKSAL